MFSQLLGKSCGNYNVNNKCGILTGKKHYIRVGFVWL